MALSMKNNLNNKLSILFVCNDDTCITSISKLLKEQYQLDNIIVSKSKKEAYKLYKKSHFDIVLTNFLMSDDDGPKMVEKMRKINEDQIFVLVSKLDKKRI